MSKKKKLLIVIITVVVVAVAATTIGVSLAYWSESTKGANMYLSVISPELDACLKYELYVPVMKSDYSLCFYNSRQWENVYVYAWNDLGDSNGSFPGQLMTDVSGKLDWCQANVSRTYTKVIFSNGAASPQLNVDKTGDLTINPERTYYYNTSWAQGDQPDLFWAADYPPFENVFYYFNANEWEDVYMYAWDSTGVAQTPVEYPGEEMSPVSGYFGWYRASARAQYDRVIFNDGTPGEQNPVVGTNKTTDLTVDWQKPYYYDGWYSTFKLDYYTITYYNQNNWDEVYAYVWDASGNPPEGPEYAYPGQKMTPVAGRAGWYTSFLNSSYVNVIFNDGTPGNQNPVVGTNKTTDLQISFETPYYYESGWHVGFPDAATETYSAYQRVPGRLDITTENGAYKYNYVLDNASDRDKIVGLAFVGWTAGATLDYIILPETHSISINGAISVSLPVVRCMVDSDFADHLLVNDGVVQDLVIGANIAEIDAGFFFGMQQLETVTFVNSEANPGVLVYLRSECFGGCPLLTSTGYTINQRALTGDSDD